MTDKQGEFDPLEDFFRAGRANPAQPDDALLTRVLADAEAAQNAVVATGGTARRARPSLWAMVAGAVGGWPAMAGLATATVAGVWIGVSAPTGLSNMAMTVWGGSTGAYVVDFDASDTFQIAEGEF